MAQVVGIDIGGTGIKGAVADTVKGELVSERFKLETPHPATPDAVGETLREVVKTVQARGRAKVGYTFPAIVQHGVIKSAANVDKSWIGVNARDYFKKLTGRDAVVVNDADAAGIAEVEHGCAKNVQGTVLMLTLGTGIGSALFSNGILVPNTELGHLEVDGKEAEARAANSVRERKGLSWNKYAKRLDRVLHEYENLFSPDLFVIGGGISKKAAKYVPRLTVETKIVPAQLQNQAGIVGAAMAVVRSR